MKAAFVISGLDIHRTAAGDHYAPLRDGLASKGYEPKPVPISWRRTTPSQFADKFRAFYGEQATDRNIIVGNSFGAVVAFVTAASLEPDALYLCSLSAYFREDRPKRSDSQTIAGIGKRRAQDLWGTSFTEVAAQYDDAQFPTTVTHGEQEVFRIPLLVDRCSAAAGAITNARLVELPGAFHNMADPTYTNALLDVIE